MQVEKIAKILEEIECLDIDQLHSLMDKIKKFEKMEKQHDQLVEKIEKEQKQWFTDADMDLQRRYAELEVFVDKEMRTMQKDFKSHQSHQEEQYKSFESEQKGLIETIFQQNRNWQQESVQFLQQEIESGSHEMSTIKQSIVKNKEDLETKSKIFEEELEKTKSHLEDLMFQWRWEVVDNVKLQEKKQEAEVRTLKEALKGLIKKNGQLDSSLKRVDSTIKKIEKDMAWYHTQYQQFEQEMRSSLWKITQWGIGCGVLIGLFLLIIFANLP